LKYSTKWNVVVAPTTYTPGTNINIVVSGSIPFRGILVTASKGTIAVPGGGLYQRLGCTAPISAVTHTDTTDKGAALTLTFTPPAAGSGTVTITSIIYGSRTGSPRVCDYFGKDFTLTEAGAVTPKPTTTAPPVTPKPVAVTPKPATAPPVTPKPATAPPVTPKPVGPTSAPPTTPSTAPTTTAGPATTTATPVFMGDIVVLPRHSTLRVTKIDPGDEFSAQSFSESALAPAFGPVGFGYNVADFNVSKFGGSFTEGTTDLFIRSTVTLSQAQFDQMQGAILKVAVDDAADLWVRGEVIDTSASAMKSLTASYFTQTFNLPKSKFAVGPNIIAAHVVNLVTPTTMLYDLEVVLVFPRPGTTPPTTVGNGPVGGSPAGTLAPGAACTPGASGCVCKLMNKCDVTEATCDDGICLVRGCVKGEAGCPCLADSTCIGVGRECRGGQCVFPSQCPMPGLEPGCQCTAAGACVGTSASPLKCLMASDVCLQVRQYTCNAGEPGCWCKSDQTCASDDTICVDKGFGRKNCVFKVLMSADVTAASTTAISVFSIVVAALLAMLIQ
jgi:hypothetical protein